MSRSKVTRWLAYLGVCLIAASFVSLGIWQWNRAAESRKPVAVNSNLVSLSSITHPRIALPANATLRHVQISGTYIADFRAPNQVDGAGKSADWEIGLLATQPGAAILVVRGLWSERDPQPISASTKVIITGKLMPHQSDNYAAAGKGVLARIDSSLVVNETSLDLFDGYVIADSEKVNDGQVLRSRITPPAPRSAVPGFYWQHISYIVIWWLMAGIVLYLPFYQRRVAPEEQLDEEASVDGAK